MGRHTHQGTGRGGGPTPPYHPQDLGKIQEGLALLESRLTSLRMAWMKEPTAFEVSKSDGQVADVIARLGLLRDEMRNFLPREYRGERRE